MLTFSQLGNYGRLGNQLFQIASTIGIARKNDMSVSLPKWEYEKYFNLHANEFIISEPHKIGENQFQYQNYIFDRYQDYDLHGYFQSEKYFENCKDQIKRIFTFQGWFKEDVLIKISNAKNLITLQPLIAISVRRGDYVNNSNYVQIGLDYYSRALELMPKDAQVIVFSDDLNWCKDHMHTLIQSHTDSIIYTDGLSEIESLCLLSMCDHFIIPNSTFAWWGAWLGEKEHTITVAPTGWFGEGMKHKNDKDIIPERWKKLPVKNQNTDFGDYQVDLKDVTFTIPVMYDHEDRRQNLELVVCFLQKHFDTNIMVWETGAEPRLQHMSKFVNYRFVQNDKMHRTRMLNQMAEAATTPIIFNYDADVFFHPSQILESINKIRKNEADGCYPYDGRFVRLDRSWFGKIQQTISTKELHSYVPKPHEETQTSYGGAVAWNKEKFFEGGGENENFISYGAEDFERYHRFSTLGYRLERVKGYLFHINHYIGANSNTSNPFFNQNQQEYEKVKSMSVDMLKKYITAGFSDPQIEEKKELGSQNATSFDVGTIFCLNLVRREDRKLQAINQFEQAGIKNVNFFAAIDGKTLNIKPPEEMTHGMVGCFESHKAIVKEALAKGYDRICVFEDDLVIMPNFVKYFEKAIKELPKDWEFAYLGCTEHNGHDSHKSRINKYWVIPNSVWGTHAYMVNGKEALQKLWHGMQTMITQIDMQLTHHILPSLNFKYYALYPNNCISQNLELGGNIQEWNDLDKGTKHEEKKAIAPPITIPVAPTEDEVKKLEKQWRIHYKHAAFNHSELVHLAEHYKEFIVNGIPLPKEMVEKLGKNAKTVVDTFKDDINPIWAKLDHFKKTGTLPEPPKSAVVQLPDNPVELMKMKQNLRTYISKAKKGTKFNKTLAEMEAEMVEIDNKLNS